MLSRLFGRKQESAPSEPAVSAPVAQSPPVPACWPWGCMPGVRRWFAVQATVGTKAEPCSACGARGCQGCSFHGFIRPRPTAVFVACASTVRSLHWHCVRRLDDVLRPVSPTIEPSYSDSDVRFSPASDSDGNPYTAIHDSWGIPPDRVFLTEPEARACADRLNAEAAAKEAK